jgi:replicative DNA helicase
MTVWAARPGVGKTSFACQVAMNLAEQKHKVAFLSLEMTKESILERCFSLKTATPGQDLMRGVVSVSLKNKLLLFVNYCESLSLRIVDDYCHTENELYTLVEHLEFRPDVLILDHIQHIRAVERRSQWECLTEYLRYLKEIAMKYKIAVVVLSQINRTGEEAPTLANLKGTGAIEEMADSVLLFHRPDQLTEDGSNMVIEVAKNRFGPTGQFNLFFDGSCYRFYNNNHEATMAMVSEGRSGIV